MLLFSCQTIENAFIYRNHGELGSMSPVTDKNAYVVVETR